MTVPARQTVRVSRQAAHAEEAAIRADIGKRVYRLRRMLDLTQAELGARVGITFQMVAKIESGECHVTAARLLRIANALSRPVSALLGPERRRRQIGGGYE